MLHTLPAVILLSLLAAPAAPAVAATPTIAGVSFAPEIEAPGGAKLPLRSLGVLRWLVWDGYAAALYLPKGTPAREVLSDVPKRLELHYFRAIEGADFGPAAQKILERNFSAADLRGVQPRVDRMAAAYTDVAPGDRYSLTYAPGHGTELARNGESVLTLPGADFAAIYFAIWLGRRPIDADLRDALLAR